MKTKILKLMSIISLGFINSTALAVEIIDLGSAGEFSSEASSVNAAGKVAGWTSPHEGELNDHAFVYNDGAITNLTPGIRAYAINNLDHVVGYFAVGEANHAFFWHDGIFEDLGPKDSPLSIGWALNDNDHVVGHAAVIPKSCNRGCAYEIHAFSWQAGVTTDLNDLLPIGSPWLLTHAFGVNINGLIVGSGVRNGENRAFLLKP